MQRFRALRPVWGVWTPNCVSHERPGKISWWLIPLWWDWNLSFFHPLFSSPPPFRFKQILYLNRSGTIDSVIPVPPLLLLLLRLTSRKKSSVVFVWARRLSPPVPAGLPCQCLCGLELRSAVSDIKEHYLCGGHLGSQVLYISTKPLRLNIAGISTVSDWIDCHRNITVVDFHLPRCGFHSISAAVFNLLSKAAPSYSSGNFAPFLLALFQI